MRIQAQNCGPLRAGSIIGTGYDHSLYALTEDYDVLTFDGDNAVERCRLKHSLPFQFIQPMPGGFLAVADNTGYVVDLDGNPMSEIELGQYIQDVQTTSTGDIWVSYFDQGYCRNLHLNGNHNQLRTFQRGGKCVAPFGLEEIFDCYALNVTSNDEAWCCYKPNYPLVRIHKQRAVARWNPETAGVVSIAVWRDVALLQGGFNCDTWRAVRLGRNEELRHLDEVEIVSEDGEILEAWRARSRGPIIWNLHRAQVYRTSLCDLSF